MKGFEYLKIATIVSVLFFFLINPSISITFAFILKFDVVGITMAELICYSTICIIYGITLLIKVDIQKFCDDYKLTDHEDNEYSDIESDSKSL